MPLLSRGDDRKKTEKPKGRILEPKVDDRIRRGRTEMMKDAPLRELCERFWDSDQYSYQGKGGVLFRQDTVTTATGGKPPHRIRKVYNHIKPLVAAKVSAATQRVPSYEVVQTTSDHRDYAAARLAERVAVYLYDEVGVRRATTKLVTNALVQREGFLMPYFDPNVGPYAAMEKDDKIEMVGMGKIKLLSLTRSEVMWEPSCDFDESAWWAIERERLIEDVEKTPGFYGGKLSADTKDGGKDMVVETVYLERPCPEYPDGRRITVANGLVICPEEDFPVRNHKGEVEDRCPLHRLSYTVNPNGDDRGLVESLIEPQQTVNDCMNKLLEWKNRCLMPQMLAPRGSNITRPDDVPGAIKYYNPVSGQKPEWERPPAVPRELFEIRNLALQDMRILAASVDVQPEPDLAARTANAAIEQAMLGWQSFLGDLAEVHAHVAGDMLTLASLHYTDERLIELRGQYSWEALEDFKGQDLRGQTSVRVRPGTLESKGRTGTVEDLTFMTTSYPGSISAEAAWSALQSGADHGLLKSYENHVARAWRRVEELRKGIGYVSSRYAMRQDMETGDPALDFMVAGWMPRKQDNIVIWKAVFSDYMTSPAFDDDPIETQELFYEVWNGLEQHEQLRAMAQAAEQMDAAAELGQLNAAAPQGEIAGPQQRDMSAQQADPAQ
jgi:hypothetical protein